MSLIYGFGNNLHGQIDNSNTDNQNIHYIQPVLMTEFPAQEHVVSVTAGWSESVIITLISQANESSTYYWGQSGYHPIPNRGLTACSCSWNKCLVKSIQKNISLCNCLDNQNSTLDVIQIPFNQTYHSIACGDLYQLAITSDSQVGQIKHDSSNSSWYFDLLPTLQMIPVKLASCGKEHALILSTAGEVFSFGRGSRGQLGHDTLENESNPRALEALQGLQFKSIAAGGWHSLAISSSGDVYSWGWNESYQLGISNDTDGSDIGSCIATPTLIEMGNDNVTCVSCGSRHSACVTDNNKLFTWGWGKYGQLGHNHRNNVKVPQLVAALAKYQVQTVACGFWHTIVLVKK